MIDIDKKIQEVTREVIAEKKAGNGVKSYEAQQKLTTYRLIKTKEMEFKTAKNAKPFDEAAQINMLRKMVKEREDAAKTYVNAGREELANKELTERMYIKELLPPEVSENDINAYITNEFPKISKKEMGFVIKCVKDKFPTADGAVIAKLVKQYTVG